METLELVKSIKNALDDKKAEEVTILDISEISSIADYFIIANGNNSTWILMDYSDIIIHLFSKEDRQFYNLERIWKDAKPVEL